jgi:hypothetical protein
MVRWDAEPFWVWWQAQMNSDKVSQGEPPPTIQPETTANGVALKVKVGMTAKEFPGARAFEAALKPMRPWQRRSRRRHRH